MALLLKSYSPLLGVPATLSILARIWRVWGWGPYWVLGYIMLLKAIAAFGAAPFRGAQKMSFSSIITARTKPSLKTLWTLERELRPPGVLAQAGEWRVLNSRSKPRQRGPITVTRRVLCCHPIGSVLRQGVNARA